LLVVFADNFISFFAADLLSQFSPDGLNMDSVGGHSPVCRVVGCVGENRNVCRIKFRVSRIGKQIGDSSGIYRIFPPLLMW